MDLLINQNWNTNNYEWTLGKTYQTNSVQVVDILYSTGLNYIDVSEKHSWIYV